MLKHATASTFLFRKVEATWRAGLIRHPRFGRWMLPGGHVEPDENPADAALREVREETGLSASLIHPYAGILPPNPAAVVPVPLWITEHEVPAERRLPEPHIHVDHLYLAVPTSENPEINPELPFHWYGSEQLTDLEMFPDARSGLLLLFPLLDQLTSAPA